MDKCVICGAQLPDGWQLQLCERCRARQKVYQRNRYIRLVQQGRCPHCGGVAEDVKYITCRTCRKKNTAQYWAKKGERHDGR